MKRPGCIHAGACEKLHICMFQTPRALLRSEGRESMLATEDVSCKQLRGKNRQASKPAAGTAARPPSMPPGQWRPAAVSERQTAWGTAIKIARHLDRLSLAESGL